MDVASAHPGTGRSRDAAITGPVDVIVNRTARHLRSDAGLSSAILRSARETGATVHETRSLEQLDTVARALAARGTDTVVLSGGDGSYMAGTSALARAFPEGLPRVAFAPGGTASTVARNWGFGGNRERYAARLLASLRDGTALETARPTLRVKDGRRDAIGFIFGAGLVASFFDAYYSQRLQGYLGAATIVARVFVGSFARGRMASRVLSPVPCVLSVDGDPQPSTAYTLIAASVIQNLGLHMILLHRAAENHGKVHVVASALSARALGPQLPVVLAGRRLLGKGGVDTLARELRVRFTGDADAYVLDGEVLHAREVSVSPGPILRHMSLVE